jgi:hypothetical protein
MRNLGVVIRTCCFGPLLLIGAAAFAAQVNVTCINTSADAVKLNTAIENSRSGDRIQIHGTCLLNATIVLLGDRTYEGDSRTGTILRQAGGANLPALLASDSWSDDWTYTGDPIRIAQLTLDGNGPQIPEQTRWLSVLGLRSLRTCKSRMRPPTASKSPTSARMACACRVRKSTGILATAL